jgi:hypothetical protein
MRRSHSLLGLTLAALAAIVALSGCGHSHPPKDAAAPAVATSPRAKPDSTSPKEPIPVDWEMLELPLGEDNSFEPWMVTRRVEQLAGKRIRIKGLIYAGGLSQRGNIREFPLIREVGCQFGNGAPAWHVIMVELEGKLRTEYKTEPITLEGILRVKPYNGADGKTWSVYHLQGTKVE